jgi:F0F1-type ATP synthase assembly protein I
MVQILRIAARRRDPDAPPRESTKSDYIGVAMIAVVIVFGFIGALVVGLAVWLLADHARLLPTLLRFLAVAFGMALLAPSARRVVV